METLAVIREIKDNPKMYQEVLRLVEKERIKPAFPTRPSADPAQRRNRAKSRAGEAPSKEFDDRSRSVRTSSPIGDKVTYLRENYTNDDEKHVCQMCEEEMPFRRRDGEYYFEAVQLFDDLAKEHGAAYVGLCPLCAAKFKELVKRDKKHHQELRDRIANGSELQFRLDIDQGTGSIQFVEKHLLDVQGLLSAGEE